MGSHPIATLLHITSPMHNPNTYNITSCLLLSIITSTSSPIYKHTHTHPGAERRRQRRLQRRPLERDCSERRKQNKKTEKQERKKKREREEESTGGRPATSHIPLRSAITPHSLHRRRSSPRSSLSSLPVGRQNAKLHHTTR